MAESAGGAPGGVREGTPGAEGDGVDGIEGMELYGTEKDGRGGLAEEEVEEEEEEDAAAEDGEAEGAFLEAFEDGLVGDGVFEGVATVGPDTVGAPGEEKNQVGDGEPAGFVVLALEAGDDHENDDQEINGRGDEAGA